MSIQASVQQASHTHFGGGGGKGYVSVHQKGSAYRSEFIKNDEDFLEYKRQMNKLLLDEEKVENMEDAKESKFYFEKMRCLELCRLTLMVMAQVVAILDYEIEFNNQNIDLAKQFLYIIVICSVCLIIMTYFSYEAQNQYIIATKKFGKSATIFNTGQWKFMFIEMSIYLVFPQPWFQDIKVHFFVDFYQLDVYHYLNEIFLLIMLLRFLIMVKIILINTRWYTERVNRVCNLYATRMSPMFIVKVNMLQNPMRVFWFCYVFSLFTYSYAVRICERPLQRDPLPEGVSVGDFTSYANSIWCMMISIPSVGYGDIYPVTSHGRFIAAISFISGTFMLSVLCNSLMIILDFTALEAKSTIILEKLHIRDEIKKSASLMFTYAAKIQLRLRQGKGYSYQLSRKLRKTAGYFKTVNRQYKSVVDRSNLVEQLDKQFTYMGEEIGNIAESVNKAAEVQATLSQSLLIQLQAAENRQTVKLINQTPSNMHNNHTKRQQSVQYYTDDMNDAAIRFKPYNFQYNMVNHVNPNQFY